LRIRAWHFLDKSNVPVRHLAKYGGELHDTPYGTLAITEYTRAAAHDAQRVRYAVGGARSRAGGDELKKCGPGCLVLASSWRGWRALSGPDFGVLLRSLLVGASEQNSCPEGESILTQSPTLEPAPWPAFESSQLRPITEVPNRDEPGSHA
jgi:hypothetical protein